MKRPDEATIPQQIGQYFLKNTIGNGAFSIVKLAIHKHTQKEYACKIVPKAELAAKEMNFRFENEIRILQQLNHPRIVRLYDLMYDSINYYIMTELCPNGELFHFIISQRYLQESDAKVLMKQILLAIDHVHSLGIVHRDLKPENILLDSNNSIKITDFGFSRYTGSSSMVNTTCGSPCYASPECLSGKSYDGYKNDVWSLGIILYAMVTGQLPWTKQNQNELFDQIIKAEYKIPTYLSENLANLIKSMMHINENQRPTTKQILESPWFSDSKDGIMPKLSPSSVSLRLLDIFFSREISIPKIPRARLRKNESWATQNEEAVIKLIKKYDYCSIKLPMLKDQKRTWPMNATELIKMRNAQRKLSLPLNLVTKNHFSQTQMNGNKTRLSFKLKK